VIFRDDHTVSLWYVCCFEGTRVWTQWGGFQDTVSEPFA
jgi:hypothetical protein